MIDMLYRLRYKLLKYVLCNQHKINKTTKITLND